MAVPGSVVWTEPIQESRDKGGRKGWVGGIQFDDMDEMFESRLETHIEKYRENAVTLRAQRVKRYYQKG